MDVTTTNHAADTVDMPDGLDVFDPATTLGTLVERRPELARTLDGLGLDYCCGGHRPLGEACAEQGLNLAEVEEALAAVAIADAPAWTGIGITPLVDHIEETHHAYLWAEMPRLSALLDKITTVHGGRHPELSLVQDRYETLRAELEPHLREEEEALFPLVRRLADGDAGDRAALVDGVLALRDDHEAAGALLAELRLLTGEYQVPADGCATYQAAYRGLEELEADVHLHVHKENNVLFPSVEQMSAAGGERS